MQTRTKFIVVGFVILLALCVYARETVDRHTSQVAYLDVSTGANVAQVVNLVDFAGTDSFVYSDTVNDTACDWTSPLQVMHVTLNSLDSSAHYACSVTFAGADILGVDVTSAADTDWPDVTDSLVSKINQATNLKDSVVAASVDDTTFSITSKFGQETFTDRWTTKVNSVLDTATYTITTPAMVCDSMAAYINAGQGLVTAANSGDTIISLTANTAGLAYTIAAGDTSIDTSLGTANTNSWSSNQDTLLFQRVDWGARSLSSRFIIGASADTMNGVGKSDSGYLWLYHVWNDIDYVLAGSTAVATVPCTLSVNIADAAGNDTVFKEKLALVYRIADTCSTKDTTITYTIDEDYLLKD